MRCVCVCESVNLSIINLSLLLQIYQRLYERFIPSTDFEVVIIVAVWNLQLRLNRLSLYDEFSIILFLNDFISIGIDICTHFFYRDQIKKLNKQN